MKRMVDHIYSPNRKREETDEYSIISESIMESFLMLSWTFLKLFPVSLGRCITKVLISIICKKDKKLKSSGDYLLVNFGLKVIITGAIFISITNYLNVII